MGFRLVPISMTLNDLEQLQRTTTPYTFSRDGCVERNKDRVILSAANDSRRSVDFKRSTCTDRV